jgi:hypothetical protein
MRRRYTGVEIFAALYGYCHEKVCMDSLAFTMNRYWVNMNKGYKKAVSELGDVQCKWSTRRPYQSVATAITQCTCRKFFSIFKVECIYGHKLKSFDTGEQLTNE